jgi:hypothetical protein
MHERLGMEIPTNSSTRIEMQVRTFAQALATYTSDVPLIFGNLAGLPLPGGNYTLNADEHAIGESVITAWSAMVSTRNPSVSGGLQWPQRNRSTNQGVAIVNVTTVGTTDYSQCAFWDMIDNTYLTFTSFNISGASGNVGTRGGKANRERSQTGSLRGGADSSIWDCGLACYGLIGRIYCKSSIGVVDAVDRYLISGLKPQRLLLRSSGN